jgi:hypothetical protein
MRLTPLLALLCVLCLGGAASAQRQYDYDASAAAATHDPETLVRFWYQTYLGREPDVIGLDGWAKLVAQSSSPVTILAAMLSCDEYFARAGNTPDGFARTLFRDVAGREPTEGDFNWVMGRLAHDAGPVVRGNIARDLLRRYPQAVYPPDPALQSGSPGQGAPPAGPGYEYRLPGSGYRGPPPN